MKHQSNKPQKAKEKSKFIYFYLSLIDLLNEYQNILEANDNNQHDIINLHSRIIPIQKILYGKNSVEVYHSESQLGYLYNKFHQHEYAIQHLQQARFLESKLEQVDEKESINIAIELAQAYLSLDESHSKQAEEALNQYSDAQITDPYTRYKRDVVKSRIYLSNKNYNEAFSSYKEALLSIREFSGNKESREEAEIYLELADLAFEGQNSIEKFIKYHSKAQSILDKINSQNQKKELTIIISKRINEIRSRNVFRSLDQFEKMGQIGIESFGKVFKVIEKSTGAVYSAKISRKMLKEEKEFLMDKLLEKLDVFSKLNHSSFLRFVYFDRFNFTHEPKPVIITECATNGSLEDFILLDSQKSKIDERFDDTHKLIIIYGVAAGMSYLHSKNIIHRNLVPSNILLDDFLTPKIVNFDLSRIEDANEVCIEGTPRYMSPEIWEKHEYSKSSDVYAFGMIIYELLTNEKPFKNMDFFTIPEKLKEGYRPSINSSIPESYKKLIQSCWSQNPSERPSFYEITEKLKNDRSFITKSVEERIYFKFVDFVDESTAEYEKNRKIISIEKMKTFKKLSLKKERKTMLLTNETSPSSIFPIDEYIKLNENCKNHLKEAELSSNKQFFVAQCLINGHEDFPLKVSLGIKYLSQSAKNGCTEASVYYIRMLIKGDVIPRDLEKAREYLDKRISKENHQYLFLSGLIDKKEGKYEEARRKFELGINNNDSESMYEYGKMLFKGEGCEIDKEKAAVYFKKASENGSLKATFKFGLILLHGDGVASNEEEAFKLIKQAADAGNVKAMLFISSMQILDKDESVNYIRKAACKSDAEAMLKFGKMLKNGDGVPLNYEESLQYLRKAADKGQIEAEFLYGSMVADGLGTFSDGKKGAIYVKSAADKGNAEAMNKYALMLINGDGVAVDYREARRYLMNAIEKGEKNAKENYRKMLNLGFGVPFDQEEARNYLE